MSSRSRPKRSRCIGACTRYERTPLNARVEDTDDRSPLWRIDRVTIEAAYGSERLPMLLFLPKHLSPPYQTTVWYPGANAYTESTAFEGHEWQTYWFSFILRSGRAVAFPIYKGTYDRGGGRPLSQPQRWYDAVILGRKDLGRTLDYLETRPDIDAQRVAYYGLSSGAGMGPIMTAQEPRFKTSVLLAGGLYPWQRPPEVDPLNFLPAVTVPTIMLNGADDFFFPVTTSQAPMFELLGTSASDKRHRIFQSGHIPEERPELIREIVAWLDRYLGSVATHPPGKQDNGIAPFSAIRVEGRRRCWDRSPDAPGRGRRSRRRRAGPRHRGNRGRVAR